MKRHDLLFLQRFRLCALVVCWLAVAVNVVGLLYAMHTEQRQAAFVHLLVFGWHGPWLFFLHRARPEEWEL